ncbi:MAG: hypothetical protein UX61_C0004G0014 [Parcubacteria group bacterium GW2011_GWA2_46_7]|nr:MAG: hypothetical protein UX61_C0004G0014 [Parcubacteria group bacterium GW2011_GWA2_46_7]
MNEDIVLIGETDYRDRKLQFGIKIDDRRRHFYIIGRSGTGKTQLQQTLAIHDIQHGRGVGIIDPHGEFTERLLKFIPKERINGVVYFNPADINYPIGFNVMESVDSEHRHIVAASLLSVFKKIWPDVWSARMEYILNNTILALLEYPQSTLLSINRMLADKDFRKDVVINLKDPIVKAFWTDEFARYHDRFQVEAIAPIQNKVGQFASNPLIRNIVGQVVSKINIREIIDNKKILIARMSTGLIGEGNASLLGGLLITKLQQAAMSRIDVPEASRQDFFLFIDEFQNFATESFANILAEARKYRLDLTLAHQYVEQLPDTIKAAIFGNVGSMAIFRIGPHDAEDLRVEFEPDVTATDLVNIPNWKFYMKLMIDGVVSAPFMASTLAPLPVPDQSYDIEIIDASRAAYGTPKELVENAISEWMLTVAGEKMDKEDKEKILDKETPLIHTGTCQTCGRGVQVPFEPDPKKPLYCKQCLKKVKRERAPSPASAPAPVPGKVKPPLPKQVSPEHQAAVAVSGANQEKFKQDLADLLQRVTPQSYGTPADTPVDDKKPIEA